MSWKDAMPTCLSEVGTASRMPSQARVDHQKVFPGANTIRMTSKIIRQYHPTSSWNMASRISFSRWSPGIHFTKGLVLLGEGNGTPLQNSCLGTPMDRGAWWATVHGVVKSRTQLSNFTFTSDFHALEKEMATHSSALAWRIPGTAEPGGLPSMGSHRVGHD